MYKRSLSYWPHRCAAMIAVILFYCLSVFAEKEAVIYREVKDVKLSAKANEKLDKIKIDKKSKIVKLVDFNYTCLEDDVLNMTLPDGVKFKLTRKPKRANWQPDGSNTWNGDYQDANFGVSLLLAAGQSNRDIRGTMTMWNYTPRGAIPRCFSIETVDDGVHIFRELDIAYMPSGICGTK